MSTPPTPTKPTPAPCAGRLWRQTQKLTAALLGVWLVFNLTVPWFALDLNAVSFGGFPLGYWIAAQGGLLVYLLLIVLYVWGMDRLEARYAAECRGRPGAAVPVDAAAPGP